MPQRTGTYDLTSLLAVTNQSAAEFGIDRIAEVLQQDIDAHNRIVVEDLLPELAEVTTDRQRIAGIVSDTEMMEVDDYGRAPTQVEVTPPTLGFPLRLFQHNIGWTEKFMEAATPADLAKRTLGAEGAHLRALRKAIQRAFYISANYTWVDRLIDSVSLAVKRLANADGFAIPTGPNGEAFDASTHTHYLAEAALSAAGATSLVNTVIEHEVAGTLRIAINSANEAAWRALSGFVAAADPRLILATNASQAEDRLDIMRLNDRMIGYFGAAEVWVKPWALANYAVAYIVAPETKPLVFRQRTQATLQGLRIAAETRAFPLTARFMEAEFGVGVWNRVAMAVLYHAGGAYVDPTIT